MEALPDHRRNAWVSFFALFTSAGTLICCALPALFVSLGLGAAFAGLVSNVPQIVWFSENKAIVFSVAGILIAVSAVLQYRARNAPCPVDPELARACTTSRVWSKRILVFSGLAYLTGFFFAFIAPRIWA